MRTNGGLRTFEHTGEVELFSIDRYGLGLVWFKSMFGGTFMVKQKLIAKR